VLVPGFLCVVVFRYYLPLNRVVRALDYVRRREVPPRGCVQAVFTHEAFNEVRALALACCSLQSCAASVFSGAVVVVVARDPAP
jgi:hypothetical protein